MQEVKFLEDNKYTDNKITDYLFYYFEKEFLVIFVHEDDSFNLCDLNVCEKCDEKCYNLSELKEPINVKSLLREEKLKRIIE